MENNKLKKNPFMKSGYFTPGWKDINDLQYIRITFKPIKPFKNKYYRWIYWNIYWQIYKIWRPKLLSKTYFILANIFEYIANKLRKYGKTSL